MRVNNGLTPQDLKAYGINDVQDIVHNPSYDTLYEEELAPNLEGYERGVLTNLGAIAVDTGIFTGRSPKDKYIVRDDTTRDTVWWADKGKGKNDNKPLSEETWQHLKGLVTRQLSGKRLFIVDAFCGANADTRLSVRFITEVAWQAHFVKNMFIRPGDEELANFKPDFIVMNGAKCTNPQWKEQGLNSENFVAFNLTERIQLIGGTWYGGEMKKGMFSIMNYLLPLKGIASMHCSANVGEKEDVAIFFGLSGTGKTTLSTDPKRRLIGDDEHGWDDDGVFNFEGGCYAKTIKLSEAAEPDIYHAIRRDALLENVVVLADGTIDFNDGSKTENTRVSYPINHIENIVKPISKAGHATKVIFLTADAFGVLPPVSRLTAALTDEVLTGIADLAPCADQIGEVKGCQRALSILQDAGEHDAQDEQCDPAFDSNFVFFLFHNFLSPFLSIMLCIKHCRFVNGCAVLIRFPFIEGWRYSALGYRSLPEVC